jgi:hypothetical protein
VSKNEQPRPATKTGKAQFSTEAHPEIIAEATAKAVSLGYGAPNQ